MVSEARKKTQDKSLEKKQKARENKSRGGGLGSQKKID
jgi:hypothetical protein